MKVHFRERRQIERTWGHMCGDFNSPLPSFVPQMTAAVRQKHGKHPQTSENLSPNPSPRQLRGTSPSEAEHQHLFLVSGRHVNDEAVAESVAIFNLRPQRTFNRMNKNLPH